MRRTLFTACVTILLVVLNSAHGVAQVGPRPLPRVAFDIRGSLPSLPDDPAIAESRGLLPVQLPGRALGADAGIHLYLFKWKAVTFGIGGHGTLARARFTPDDTVAGLTAVNERLLSLTSQLSLNFGTGDGWSYLSGGVGRANWRIVPEGAILGPADRDQLYTVNYGGGARWFTNSHVGITFDVRFHQIAPGISYLGRPGSPRASLLILSAGMSLK